MCVCVCVCLFFAVMLCSYPTDPEVPRVLAKVVNQTLIRSIMKSLWHFFFSRPSKQGGKGGSRSRLTENKYSFTIHEKQRHDENHVYRELYILFFVSRKILLENHAFRLPHYGNHDSRGKLNYFLFHGEKRADHGSRKYSFPPSVKTKYQSDVMQVLTGVYSWSFRNSSIWSKFRLRYSV